MHPIVMAEKKLTSFLWKLYGFTFCQDLVFAYPIYAVLFQARGLSVFQISLLMMWWSLSAGLFELPSGALADHWRRKPMLVLSALIKAGCFVVWRLADGAFALYALGFTLWSVSEAFVSGTQEAMLYDALAQVGHQPDFEKILGRQRLFYQAALAISGIAGGIIAQTSLDRAVIWSVMPLGFAALFAALMVDPPRHDVQHETHYLAHIAEAWEAFKTNPVVRYVFVYMLLGIGIFADTDEYDPLYFTLVGIPLSAFGLLGLSRNALEAIGGLIAHRLSHLAWLETAIPLITGGLLIFAGAAPRRWMILALLVCYFLVAPMAVRMQGKLQHAIPGTSRATVTSAAAFFGMLAGQPLLMGFGLVSDRWRLGSGYVFFGCVLLAFSVWTMSSRLAATFSR